MLMDIIKSRHSIRKYTDRQISREDLEKILEAGSLWKHGMFHRGMRVRDL